MGTSISLNATSYTIPATSEDSWGTDVSNYLIALSTGVLSKAGGAFTLTAETDFGTGFGLKSIYYKSRGTVASAGVLRLANDELVSWRNAANDANLSLKVNASNILEFNSNPVFTLALGTGNQFLSMNAGATAYEWKSLLDEDNFASNSDTNAPTQQSVKAYADAVASTAASNLSSHVTDTTNPHSVTATQVGLGNVNNTSDLNKPISTATQTALDAKFNDADVIDEDNMASNLDTKVPTQQSVKAYVDAGDATKANLSGATFTGNVIISNAESLRLAETNGNGTHFIGIKAPDSVTADVTFTLPDGDGAAGQALKTDGAGQLEWGDASGGGGINYIDNNEATVDTTGWVDGTAIAITRTTSTPLRGAGSFLIATTGSVAAGAYVAYAFTLDSADANKVLSLSFDHTNGPTAYASGDLEVVIVRDPLGTPQVITPATSAIPATTGAHGFATTWVSGAAGAYELRFRAVTATSAYDVKLDNVSVGPQSFAFGVPSSDWTAFTPTGLWVTNTTYTGWWKRNGDNISLRYKLAMTGSPGIGGHLWISLPSGLTIDTTKIDNNTSQRALGTCSLLDNGSGVTNGIVAYFNTTAIALQTYLADAFGNVTQTAPFSMATGDTIWVEVPSLPIAEWAGSSVWLSSAKAEYASNSSVTDSNDTTSFVYGPSGSFLPSTTKAATSQKHVKFLTPIQPTDVFETEISYDGGTTWLRAGPAGVRTTSNTLSIEASSAAGVAVVHPVNSTTVAVNLGQYRAGTANWAAGTGAAKWRVVKYPGVIQSAMPYYQRTETISVGGDFTGTANAIVSRVGNQVIITGTEYWSHSSAVSASSAVGVVPAWARPANDNVFALIFMNGSFIARGGVTSAGTITTNYRNWSGTAAAQTVTGSTFNITYTVAD